MNGKWNIQVYDNSIYNDDGVVSQITEELELNIQDSKNNVIIKANTNSFNKNQIKLSGKSNGNQTVFLLAKN